MSDHEPIPVEITIKDRSFERYITVFEMDHRARPDNRLTLRLDNDDELSLPIDMAEPLLEAYQEPGSEKQE